MSRFGDGERLGPVRGTLASYFSRIWRRRRFLAVTSVALLLSVGLVEASLLPISAGYQQILVNVGASFLGVVATVLFLEPLIERSRRPEEIIHAEFPYALFMDGVMRSSRQVRILGAWPYVMDHPWRTPFVATLEDAARRGVRIQILVLDPESKAAEQRARDLDNRFDVASVINEVLHAFWELHRSLPERAAEQLEVRVYSLLPPARMYRWDSRAISSFFPMGNWVGSDIKHYETNMSSRLAQFVDEQFELIWRDIDSVALRDYFELVVDIAVPEQGFLSRTAEYVVYEQDVYVAGHDIVEELYRLRVVEPQVRLAQPVRGARLGDGRLMLIPVDPANLPHVRTLFGRKYGRRSPLEGNASVLVIGTAESR